MALETFFILKRFAEKSSKRKFMTLFLAKFWKINRRRETGWTNIHQVTIARVNIIMIMFKN